MRTSALVGQAVKQSPQPVHRAALIAGRGGPPMRGAKRIACSEQVSAHDWQCTKRLARQSSVIATRAAGRDRTPVSNERRVVGMMRPS
jgi:hypothetical protein